MVQHHKKYNHSIKSINQSLLHVAPIHRTALLCINVKKLTNLKLIITTTL